jgi:hypothetical protein
MPKKRDNLIFFLIYVSLSFEIFIKKALEICKAFSKN